MKELIFNIIAGLFIVTVMTAAFVGFFWRAFI